MTEIEKELADANLNGNEAPEGKVVLIAETKQSVNLDEIFKCLRTHF